MPNLPDAERVLIVGAHPDDPDFFCAGTVARLAARGAAVHYLIVTSGDKGRLEPSDDPATFTAVREAEQQASAAYVGAEGVTFLCDLDGEVFDTLDLRRRITAEIRRFRPDLIMTHDPLTRQYRQHPDHRAVGFATINSAFPSCRIATYFPEQVRQGLQPHIVGQMLLFGTDRPDRFVDISSVFDQKVAALELHRTQALSFTGGLHARLERRSREAGEPVGLDLAESFHFVDLL